MDSLTLDAEMKVTLEIIDGYGEDEQVLSLKSAIEEVIGDKYLLIYEPMHMGLTYQLPKYDSVLMSINTETSRHILQVRYVESVVQGGLRLIKVKRLGFVENDQRRACFRLPLSAPVKIGLPVHDEEDGQPHDSLQVTDGRTIDLSDSGLLFSTNEHFEAGNELQIEIDLDTDTPLIGSVVRTHKSDRPKFAEDVAVELKHADIHEKDHLYKYIVKKELDMMHHETPHHDSQHHDSQHNDPQHHDSSHNTHMHH